MAKITPRQMIEYFDAEGSVRLIKPADLHAKAVQAGEAAALRCVPTPMVVQSHVNQLDDSSPVAESWHVAGGVCGFASVHVYFKDKESRKFLNGLIKVGVASRDINARGVDWHKNSCQGGFIYWVSAGGQSMETKMAFAGAMVGVLIDHGVNAHMQSRMD